MDTAYFRFAPSADQFEKEKIYANTFYILSFVTVITTSLIVLLNKPIAKVLGYAHQNYYVIWFAFILFFDAITTLVYAKFRQESRPIRFLMYRVANVVLIVFFTLLFLEFIPRFLPELRVWLNESLNISKDLDYVFLANLIASIIVCLMMFPSLIKIKGSIDKEFMLKAIKYSWPLVIIAGAYNFNQYIAVPIQNFFLEGSIEEKKSIAGVYGAASKLAILLNLFTTAFSYAAEPFFFNQAAKDKKLEMNGVIALAFTILCSFVVLGTYFYIDILVVMIGHGFRSGVVVVPVLLLSYLFLGLYYNFAIWYKLADKTWYGVYISLGATLITIVTSAILLPTIGMMGSAWASLFCFGFMAVMGYVWGQKYYPINYPIQKIIFYIIITAALLIWSWFMSRFNFSLPVKLTFHTFVLLLYGWFVWKNEQAFIQKHFRR